LSLGVTPSGLLWLLAALGVVVALRARPRHTPCTLEVTP